MKTTLEFSLPEEKEELNLALQALDYKVALESILLLMRNKLKHSELSKENYEFLDNLRDECLSIASENDVY